MHNSIEENLASLLDDLSVSDHIEQVRSVSTPYGDFLVTFVGDSRNPALVTAHDIGLNHKSNFDHFFYKPGMRSLMNNFWLVHIDMPGQANGDEIHIGQKTYPTVLELASGVEFIVAHFGIPCFFGFGYGAGAFILSRFALDNPDLVTGLILINANAEAASWTDHAYTRAYASFMKSSGFNRGAQEYLRWYHCGCDELCSSNLLSRFNDNILSQNPGNLAAWMESYSRRASLGLERPVSNMEVSRHNFRCPILLVVGQESPHLEATRRMFGQCDPQLATILELPDCRAPLDECSTKVFEAMVFLMQRLSR